MIKKNRRKIDNDRAEERKTPDRNFERAAYGCSQKYRKK